MVEMTVNNPNIVVNASMADGSGFRRPPRGGPGHSRTQTTLLRQLSQIRREIEERVCTSTWAEDCLFRGAEYAPDFQCACPVCRSLFPNRRHPRAVRESAYSLDCQVEADEDPEFAEELARLRNDRPRFGSVFMARGGGQRLRPGTAPAQGWPENDAGDDETPEGES
ncbi:MAG: hypothetical protein ABSD28_05805 [Tepidisphaeraceae bacterium]|jgi:hypothetical protein